MYVFLFDFKLIQLQWAIMINNFNANFLLPKKRKTAQIRICNILITSKILFFWLIWKKTVNVLSITSKLLKSNFNKNLVKFIKDRHLRFQNVSIFLIRKNNLQSSLCTTTHLDTPRDLNKWSFDRSAMIKVRFILLVVVDRWLLFQGGH